MNTIEEFEQKVLRSLENLAAFEKWVKAIRTVAEESPMNAEMEAHNPELKDLVEALQRVVDTKLHACFDHVDSVRKAYNKALKETRQLFERAENEIN